MTAIARHVGCGLRPRIEATNNKRRKPNRHDESEGVLTRWVSECVATTHIAPEAQTGERPRIGGELRAPSIRRERTRVNPPACASDGAVTAISG